MTDTQISIIRAIQDGLPISDKPFDEIAQQVGIEVDDLLAQLREWRSDGTIRRFGAILRHHRAGYDANTMVVWDVPEDQIENFAAEAVSYQNISHCYQRPRFAGFQYNLYTMIHGKCREDCETITQSIAERTGIRSYALLHTTTEFKKSSPVYFTPAEIEE